MCHQLLPQLGFWASLVSSYKPKDRKVWSREGFCPFANIFCFAEQSVACVGFHLRELGMKQNCCSCESPASLWPQQRGAKGLESLQWAPSWVNLLGRLPCAPRMLHPLCGTQVLPVSLCMAAAVLVSQEGPAPVLLITLVVISRLLHSWVHTQHPHHGKGVGEL